MDTTYFLDRYLPSGSYVFRMLDPQLIKNIEFYEQSMEDKDICIPIRLNISLTTNLDHDDDHFVPIHTMPDGTSQVDSEDDIMIGIIFNDDKTVDQDFKRIDFENESDFKKLKDHFTLTDINSGEVFLPSKIELVDFDDDEVEASLIWKKSLFDKKKKEGYRLRFEFDGLMYDKNNLHYQVAKEVIIE